MAATAFLLWWFVTPFACAWKGQFADMKAQIDAMPIPRSYERLYETQQGSTVRIFGEYATVHRSYRSPTDPERTCEELAEALRELSWAFNRHPSGCSISVHVPSGWRGRLFRVTRYQGGVLVTAMRPDREDRHPAEPEGVYTRVAVTLKDTK